MSLPPGLLVAMGLDADLRAMAERQHGVVARSQASELGANRSALRVRLDGPDWDRATPRVLRLVGAPRTPHQRLMVAVLDAGHGAVVSHHSAAALWGLPGFGHGRVHLSRQQGRSGRPPLGGARLHRPRLLPPTHVTRRDHIPVTSLARTLFDLAAVEHPARVARLVDTVVARAPSLLGTLHRTLDELGARGRDGVASMRQVLVERPLGSVPPGSGTEARLTTLLVEAGEAPLDRQVDVGGHEWVGRVDFADRRLGVLVEVDSELHHSSRLDRDSDRRRDAALRAAGFRSVVRITEDQVWRRPWEAVAAVRRARAAARYELRSGSQAPARDPDLRSEAGPASGALAG